MHMRPSKDLIWFIQYLEEMRVGYPLHVREGHKIHRTYIIIAGCLSFWQISILLYILSARHRDEFQYEQYMSVE